MEDRKWWCFCTTKQKLGSKGRTFVDSQRTDTGVIMHTEQWSQGNAFHIKNAFLDTQWKGPELHSWCPFKTQPLLVHWNRPENLGKFKSCSIRDRPTKPAGPSSCLLPFSKLSLRQPWTFSWTGAEEWMTWQTFLRAPSLAQKMEYGHECCISHSCCQHHPLMTQFESWVVEGKRLQTNNTTF